MKPKNYIKNFMSVICWKIALVFVFGLLTQQIIRAQGSITCLSNLSDQSIGNTSNARASFLAGNNPGGYNLNAIQLAMLGVTGSPNSFLVTLYSLSDSGGSPSFNYLGTLNGTSPLIAGIYTFTPASSLILSPDSYYSFYETGNGNGAYLWSITSSPFVVASNGWSGGSGPIISPQYAIIATPVPEPNTLSFFTLGGLVFFWRRVKCTPKNLNSET